MAASIGKKRRMAAALSVIMAKWQRMAKYGVAYGMAAAAVNIKAKM